MSTSCQNLVNVCPRVWTIETFKFFEIIRKSIFKRKYLPICRHLRDKTYVTLRERICQLHVRISSMFVQGFGRQRHLNFSRLFESQYLKGKYLPICRHHRDKPLVTLRENICQLPVKVTSMYVQGFGGQTHLNFQILFESQF